QLSDIISLKGNKTKEEVAQLFKKSEFILLPSKIEGWPKAVAEGMFWGCVPISTPISCVPYMLDQGNRGILLTLNLDNDSKQIANLINNNKRYQNMSELAKKWSREYTMEKFENELVKLLQ